MKCEFADRVELLAPAEQMNRMDDFGRIGMVGLLVLVLMVFDTPNPA
ncbi:MAG: hypothetical protein PSX80_05555 [bacterium]|nr:hypothetical protein [bacterium]